MERTFVSISQHDNINVILGLSALCSFGKSQLHVKHLERGNSYIVFKIWFSNLFLNTASACFPGFA